LANTWEYKTVSIIADISGVVNNNNGNGMELWFPWTLGSDYTGGTSGSWGSYSDANFAALHSQNALLTTLNATWQITGVQLEVGSSASSFAHENYGDTLRKCRRYYYKWQSKNGYSFISTGYAYSTVNANIPVLFPIELRANPH
jgi:hypothetical protein